MLYIITSPRVYTTLQAEIESAMVVNKISNPIVHDTEACGLPYLQAVIKEGLRIFPPGTGLMSKQVPREGDTINRVFLLGGTKIGSNLCAVLRNTDVFGLDANTFRPRDGLRLVWKSIQR